MSTIALTLHGSGLSPCGVRMWPMKGTLCCFSLALFLFSLKFCSDGTNISVVVNLPLSGCVAVANYHKVICNDLDSIHPLYVFSHFALPDFSCILNSKGRSFPSVAPEGSIESCEKTGVLVYFHLPKTITGIKYAKHFCPIESGCNFFYCGHWEMFTLYGHIQFPRI